MIIKWIPLKILYGLTKILAKTNRIKVAIKIIEKRIKLGDENPYLKIHISNLYNQNHQHTVAVSLIEELASHYSDNNENAVLRWGLARAFLSLREYAKAIPLLDDSTKYWEDNASPNAFKGMAYLLLHKYDSAEISFKDALKINNKHL